MRTASQSETIEDIFDYMNEPVTRYLNVELGVCAILDLLLSADYSMTGLALEVQECYPGYRLSIDNAKKCIKFLAGERMIERSANPNVRLRVWQLKPEHVVRAQDLAKHWQTYRRFK